MDTWVYFVLAFLAFLVIYLIVGYIGHKVADGVENSIRTRKMEQKKNEPQKEQKTESLADRYR